MNPKPLTLLFLEGSIFFNQELSWQWGFQEPSVHGQGGTTCPCTTALSRGPEEKVAMALCLGILSADSCV